MDGPNDGYEARHPKYGIFKKNHKFEIPFIDDPPEIKFRNTNEQHHEVEKHEYKDVILNLEEKVK